MPNYAANYIVFRATATEKLIALKEWMAKGKNPIDFKKIIPPPADMFEGALGDKERKMCKEKGIENWYDWQIANWGTKWNASNSCVIQDTPFRFALKFDTAWSSPKPVMAKIIEYCQNNKITFVYFNGNEGGGDGEFIELDEELIKEEITSSYNVYRLIGEIQ